MIHGATVKVIAQFSAISAARLEGDGLTFGMNKEEREAYSFDEPQTTPLLVQARALLVGTSFDDKIPAPKKKNEPVDMKLVTQVKNGIVYHLAATNKMKVVTPEERNRLVLAIACLGFTKLAEALTAKLNPIRIETDGDVLVLNAPPGSLAVKYHASQNKEWRYHGDTDKKWAKNPPYIKTTGEIREHVRTVPAKDEAKLMAVLKEAFPGRVLIRDNNLQLIES